MAKGSEPKYTVKFHLGPAEISSENPHKHVLAAGKATRRRLSREIGRVKKRKPRVPRLRSHARLLRRRSYRPRRRMRRRSLDRVSRQWLSIKASRQPRDRSGRFKRRR